MSKREHKRQYDYGSILTDDESELGDTVARQKRSKRTKKKDDKLEVSNINLKYLNFRLAF